MRICHTLDKEDNKRLTASVSDTMPIPTVFCVCIYILLSKDIRLEIFRRRACREDVLLVCIAVNGTVHIATPARR